MHCRLQLNIVDLQSFATKLLGTNINNIDAKISITRNVNDIVASNNDNLKVNNLDVNKIQKQMEMLNRL